MIVDQVRLLGMGSRSIVFDVGRTSKGHFVFQDSDTVNLQEDRPNPDNLDIIFTGFSFCSRYDGNGLEGLISNQQRRLPTAYLEYDADNSDSNAPLSSSADRKLPVDFFKGADTLSRDLRVLKAAYAAECSKRCRHIKGQPDPITCSREEGDPIFYPKQDKNISIRRPVRQLAWLHDLSESEKSVSIPHVAGCDLGIRNPLAATDTAGNQITIGHSSGHQIRNLLKRESLAQSKRDMVVQQDPSVIQATAELKKAEDEYSAAFLSSNPTAALKLAELARADAELKLSLATKKANKSEAAKKFSLEMAKIRDKKKKFSDGILYSIKRIFLHGVVILPRLDIKGFSSESLLFLIFFPPRCFCFVILLFVFEFILL